MSLLNVLGTSHLASGELIIIRKKHTEEVAFIHLFHLVVCLLEPGCALGTWDSFFGAKYTKQ